MCVSCDCGEHADGHGDHRHITYEMLQASAAAAEITVAQVVQNIVEAVKTHKPD